MDTSKLDSFVETEWTNKAFPALCDFIKIDNMSPDYDSDWYSNKKLITAVNYLKDFGDNYGIKGYKSEIIGNTLKPKKDKEDPDVYYPPLLFITVEPSDSKIQQSILLYGHCDKQPPNDGWDQDKFPYNPVVVNDRLYGRGSSDDGYAIFVALLSIKAIQQQGLDHPRFYIVVEAEEESSSPNLLYFIKQLYTDVI